MRIPALKVFVTILNLMKLFIAYLRISNAKSGGLNSHGIEAQRQAVERYLASVPDAHLLATFQEIESGRNNKRPQLAAALALAKKHKATICFSRWDRLGRNAAFLLTLQDSGVDMVAVDNPHIDKFIVGILALVAQKEVETLSLRVKQALVVARQRGKTLGNPRLADARRNAHGAIQERKKAFQGRAIKVIRDIQGTGVESLNRVADYLNRRAEPTARGNGSQWTATAVKRVLTAK